MIDTKGTIFAIDPGNIKSGYVIVEYDEHDITRVVDKGKVDNYELRNLLIAAPKEWEVVIEMIASQGMAVGATVFETCVWIGRFMELAQGHSVSWIYRREEKLCMCGTPKAKDGNIAQALADRYAPGEPRRGKGTKKNPGFFYGFGNDIWQAMAVATTYYDKYIKHLEF